MNDWTEPTTFGALLRELRHDADLTQLELASRAGLSVRGIQHLERGNTRPYRHTRDQLAEALGLSGEDRTRFEALSTPAPRRRETDRARRPDPASAPGVPSSVPVVPTDGRNRSTQSGPVRPSVVNTMSTVDGGSDDSANRITYLIALACGEQALLQAVDFILAGETPTDTVGTLDGLADRDHAGPRARFISRRMGRPRRTRRDVPFSQASRHLGPHTGGRHSA